MAMSLAFHIVFAVIGIAMPVLMILAERRWLRTGDPVALELAKRWAKGTAVLFAVGAVSGTVLSFELGLLWPGFMEWAGPIIGMPFSLEGFAFFTEAIFLGIYLYGWDRISRRAHLWSGVAVAVSGAVSGIFVVIANAWMNAPTGFRVVDGQAVDIDPLAAMATPAAFSQTLHMTLAAYAATGLAAAGVHAWFLLRGKDRTFHTVALRIALMVGIPAALVQPVSGHLSAQFVARHQPAKLAAMEAHWETQPHAPLRIGGWPDEARETTRWSIELPGMLSFLAFDRTDAVVTGLRDIPRDERPPVAVTHVAFQVMVALGTMMAAVSVWALVTVLRRRELVRERWLLRALVVMTPAGFIAVEAGWVTTEVGRQPWIIHGVMKTADAVTPMPGLAVPFALFTALYVLLAIVTTIILGRQMLVVPKTPTTTRPVPTPPATLPVAAD